MEFSLDGRTAIVTGGASGIGRAVATTFAAAGASVVVADVDDAGGVETVETIEDHGGEAAFVATDVRDADDVAATVEATRERFGGLDVLVNNAGGSYDDDTLTRVSEAAFDRNVEVNLKGQFLFAREAAAAMIAGGGGAMVHVSSVNATHGIGLAAYSAAKAGILALSRTLAIQYGTHGIRSNALVPGTILTDASSQKLASGETREEWLEHYPVGRFGMPEDVAAAALFLVSDAAGFVTGTEIVVDGGLSAGVNQRLERTMYDIDRAAPR